SVRHIFKPISYLEIQLLSGVSGGYITTAIASARQNPIVITNTASLRRERFGFGIMDNAKKPPANIKRPVRNGSSIFTFNLSKFIQIIYVSNHMNHG
ncbi:hypothetical protein P0248_23625, partial [Citrobacter freundii]|uniref:hypothetical protein n=1 Tax=Citrobacter freundii TaxID=546 RepID=UPI0034D5CDAC